MIAVDSPSALLPSELIDSTHEDVLRFAVDRTRGMSGAEAARALFVAVRDEVRYEGVADFSVRSSYRASDVLRAGRGFCVGKASLLAAAARALGIPALLGFADVLNHLATPRLRSLIDGDVVAWHGYTALGLGGRWLKVSPAFDCSTCARLGTRVVDFDGQSDALLQPFDLDGRRHMEYVHEHGLYVDVPFSLVSSELAARHPRVLALARQRSAL
ncbi:MAG: transglutaminase family protein [Polyangiaceae bacterium]